MWPMIVGMLWWCVMFVRLATVTLLILPDSTSHHVILTAAASHTGVKLLPTLQISKHLTLEKSLKLFTIEGI